MNPHKQRLPESRPLLLSWAMMSALLCLGNGCSSAAPGVRALLPDTGHYELIDGAANSRFPRTYRVVRDGDQSLEYYDVPLGDSLGMLGIKIEPGTPLAAILNKTHSSQWYRIEGRALISSDGGVLVEEPLDPGHVFANNIRDNCKEFRRIASVTSDSVAVESVSTCDGVEDVLGITLFKRGVGAAAEYSAMPGAKPLYERVPIR